MSMLRERLQAALVPAMKARDTAAVAALRSALAAIENAAAVAPAGDQDAAAPGIGEAASAPPSDAAASGGGSFAKSAAGLGVSEVARRAQDDAEVERIVRAEITDRLAAADEYDHLQRPEQAQRLRAEARALASHLDGA
ncbi:hypothetical protein EV385_4698 [Krasilnikovia cinnamomea]|uniref:GatB/YqeY domain-containing protein n=1 Tax=Krasilnikovia cinnamomea TaxID=349313 RepID=A0A4Q7ZPZ7_9ACTN|nr:hypothetical protein [Krasilnikovia cinnamomea]RZU52814.1 hypothetical protein EV385_4698 [Krasilnikovia cinnamomea]